MRDLSGFVKDEINDINVMSLLLKWFTPRQKNDLKYNILSPSLRFLTEQEKSQLKECLDAENVFSYNLEAELISGFRLQIKNEVYHSKEYRSMAKTCGFLVKYTEENSYFYAFICFYIQLNDQIFAYVEMINTKANKFTYNIEWRWSNLVQSIRNEGVFEENFKIGFCQDTHKFINCKNIICKSIYLKIPDEEDFFYVIDFINENEHD